MSTAITKIGPGSSSPVPAIQPHSSNTEEKTRQIFINLEIATLTNPLSSEAGRGACSREGSPLLPAQLSSIPGSNEQVNRNTPKSSDAGSDLNQTAISNPIPPQELNQSDSFGLPDLSKLEPRLNQNSSSDTSNWDSESPREVVWLDE